MHRPVGQQPWFSPSPSTPWPQGSIEYGAQQLPPGVLTQSWVGVDMPPQHDLEQAAEVRTSYRAPIALAAVALAAVAGVVGIRGGAVDVQSPFEHGHWQKPTVAEGTNWGNYGAVWRTALASVGIGARPVQPRAEAVAPAAQAPAETPPVFGKVKPGVVQRAPVAVKKYDCWGDAQGTFSAGHPDSITIHYTVDEAKGTPESLCTFMKGRGVSVQYFVDYKGNAYLMVANPNAIASQSKGENSFSVGIENGARNEKDMLNQPAQYATLVNLIADLMEKNGIHLPYNNPSCNGGSIDATPRGVKGHYEVSCSKMDRTDPGTTVMKYLRADLSRLLPGDGHPYLVKAA